MCTELPVVKLRVTEVGSSSYSIACAVGGTAARKSNVLELGSIVARAGRVFQIPPLTVGDALASAQVTQGAGFVALCGGEKFARKRLAGCSEYDVFKKLPNKSGPSPSSDSGLQTAESPAGRCPVADLFFGMGGMSCPSLPM